MTKLKRLTALVLSLALTLALAGCGTPDGGASSGPGTSGSGTSDPGSSDSGTSPSPTYTYEELRASYTQRLAGLDPDEVLFTVNGLEVSAELYLYWLTYNCSYWEYTNYMYSGTTLDMAQELEDGRTVAQFLKEDTVDLTSYYVLLEHLAGENDSLLTADQQAEWEQQKADYRAQNGEEALLLLQAQSGVRDDTFTRINTYGYLYDNLMSNLIGAPSDDEIDAYIQENDILLAKHILIRTAVEDAEGNVTFATGDAILNEDGTPYTGTAEEYNAQAKAKADDLATQLAAAADPIALFDELMHAWSEDPGLARYPDGYTFSAGEMVTEFEDGTRALAYDEISAPILSPTTGYHIILRLRPDVAAELQSQELDDLLLQTLDAAEIVTTDRFEPISAAAVYENYHAYQSAVSSVGADAGAGG